MNNLKIQEHKLRQIVRNKNIHTANKIQQTADDLTKLVKEYQKILNNHQTFSFNTRQEALVRRDQLLNNYNARWGFRNALRRYKPPTGPSSVSHRNLKTNMNEARKKMRQLLKSKQQLLKSKQLLEDTKQD
jgi:ElaB/YqjD/DUF883 family membrane-anchored ribosome-binding protein